MAHRRLLSLVVVVAVLVAVTPSPSIADDLPRRDRMLRILNQTRRNHGLPVFRLNASLSHFAWQHSKRMVTANKLFHTMDLYSQVRAYSPSTWGENLGAAGTLRRVKTLWMRSSGHRHNLLKPGFRRIGIGVVKARGLVWVTAIFYGG
jgi:uncharacterized protein YkwD